MVGQPCHKPNRENLKPAGVGPTRPGARIDTTTATFLRPSWMPRFVS